MTDLELAFATLSSKKIDQDAYWSYYEGKHVLKFNRERLREIFKELDANFTENWCSVVIDSVIERLDLKGFTVAGNKAATQRLMQLWAETELNIDADDAHLSALVTGEGYIIAWPDEDGSAQAFYNDSRNVHVFYDAANPRLKRFAAKWWLGDDKYRYLTLYYPDRLEYYRSSEEAAPQDVKSAAAFLPIAEPALNPYGIVPVFHLRRERRGTISELHNVIGPQDSINKLLADMMVAAEYGAFKQRWIISQTQIRNGVLKNAPNELWNIPASDGEGQGTQVGEFSASDLQNYLQAIEQRVNTVAIISRTPKHYFFSQGGDPSGEALMTMESPINKKAQRYINRFAVVWRKLAHFLLQLDGVAVDESAITPGFDKPETVQPRTSADIRKTSVDAGIPLVTQLRREGWTQQELDEMAQDSEQAAQRQQAGIAAALLNAQEQFDKGENDDV